jgi:3-methyladenine DNA glycosylase Tag
MDGQQMHNVWHHPGEAPARTALSDALSADLKRRGFRFVGSAIRYAHLHDQRPSARLPAVENAGGWRCGRMN